MVWKNKYVRGTMENNYNQNKIQIHMAETDFHIWTGQALMFTCHWQNTSSVHIVLSSCHRYTYLLPVAAN